MLDRVLLQPQYRDKKNFVKNLRQLYAKGELSDELAKIYFGERPAEELYDVKKDPAQLKNLMLERGLMPEEDRMEVIKRHRRLMDQWLAAGDTGEGDEPRIELEMADNKKWGRGVNVEYETIRTDSDGDGLSDDWEKLNGRLPDDGRADYKFDCGGWQTEGWTAKPELGNIAGRQGFLDFEINDEGSIRRDGLSLKVLRNSRIRVWVKTNAKTRFSIALNGTASEVVLVQPQDSYQEIVFSSDQWQGEINSIELIMKSRGKSRIEIDRIAAMPDILR